MIKQSTFHLIEQPSTPAARGKLTNLWNIP